MTSPTAIRIGPALAGLAQQASENTSAALRALAFIGAHAAGLDVTSAAREIGALLAADLADEVRAALVGLLEPKEAVLQMYDTRTTDVVEPYNNRITPVVQATPPPAAIDGAGDDLFDIGIAV